MKRVNKSVARDGENHFDLNVYILDKSEIATLQYFIFVTKYLTEKYLLKLDNIP